MTDEQEAKNVSVRLNNKIIQEIEACADTKSEFIRTAIREKLGRETPHARIDRVRRDIDDLQDQVREIRLALIREAGSGYNDYTLGAGDILDDTDE